jgi:N-acyl-D-amino-acid deacylase
LKDILLSNAQVITGTGQPAQVADVLVSGGKIAEIRSVPHSLDHDVVDCAGLIVAPGFVDVHSHSDQEVLQHLTNKVLQGVTTEIVGNCGFSLFPSRPNPTGERLTGELFDGEPPEGMANAAVYFSRLDEAGSLLNVAALTGHAALRLYMLKMQREASEEEMNEMEKVLDECLATGSIGFSTGLNCAPSSFGEMEEIVRLCKVVRRHEGFYTTHVRNYRLQVIEAIEEAIAAARAAKVPLQISHMQVVGRKAWDKLDVALSRIDAAHAEGLDIAMDAYPYLAGSCSLTQLLPDWTQEGGVQRLLGRLVSSSLRERIAAETEAALTNSWDDVVLCAVRTNHNLNCIGKSIQKIADERDRLAAETALDLLLEEEGYVYIISFNQSHETMRSVLTHPLTSIITDGMVIEGQSHPRTFGTYPKFLGEFVREKRWMPLEDAIVKTSSQPARRFGLKGRGTLEAGGWADIVVFDAAKTGTQSDYDHPARDPEGIHHVIVNGQFVVRDGKLTGRMAGRPLRHRKSE